MGLNRTNYGVLGEALEPAAGMRAWYRADSYNAGASLWEDLSGNALNLALGSGIAPTVNASDANFNGEPTLEFDGTAWIESAVALSSLITGTAHTIYTVFRAETTLGTGGPSGGASPVGYTTLWCDSNNGAPGGYLNLVLGGSASLISGANIYDGGNKWALSPATVLNTVYGCRLTHDTGTHFNKISGLTEGSVAAGTPDSLADFLQIGRDYPQNAATGFDGQIAEILFYDTALGAADKTLTEDYLAGRYGLTW